MAITTDWLRGALEDAFDASEASGTALRVTLRGYESAGRKQNATGAFSSISSSGASHQYGDYGPGGLTPAEIPLGWRRLINLHDLVESILDSDATDEDKKDEMLSRLDANAASEMESDHSLLTR